MSTYSDEGIECVPGYQSAPVVEGVAQVEYTHPPVTNEGPPSRNVINKIAHKRTQNCRRSLYLCVFFVFYVAPASIAIVYMIRNFHTMRDGKILSVATEATYANYQRHLSCVYTYNHTSCNDVELPMPLCDDILHCGDGGHFLNEVNWTVQWDLHITYCSDRLECRHPRHRRSETTKKCPPEAYSGTDEPSTPCIANLLQKYTVGSNIRYMSSRNRTTYVIIIVVLIMLFIYAIYIYAHSMYKQCKQ